MLVTSPILTDDDVFGEMGAVASARVIIDRETGRSKGFGFVEHPPCAQYESNFARTSFRVNAQACAR